MGDLTSNVGAVAEEEHMHNKLVIITYRNITWLQK